jgi:dsDNA-specific endonuclease/ATPase MutS2
VIKVGKNNCKQRDSITFTIMKDSFKVGDDVAVLDDTIKGVVINVNGSDVTLEDTDGFSLTYKANELVVIKENQKELSKYIDIQQSTLIEKESSSMKKKSIKHPKKRMQPPLEVDLHIHQLTKSTKGMTNYDMLTLQIDTARRQLEFAIRKKIQRVVFIHGVGEGVLQKEIAFLLGRYHVEVQPASFQKYGFGATEIYIYQNN